jgi:predicted glutamine amidotransferase
MCVILIARSKPLTRTLVNAAMDANPHGNGFAWIEKRGKKRTVRFEKGLTRNEVNKFSLKLPLPYVFHARIASVGGVHVRLTHPFPVAPRREQLKISGASRKGVLFHNGTWMEWKQFYEGPVEELWSDSRAMADLIHKHGEQMLYAIPDTQKIVRVTTTGVEAYGTGWSEVAKGVEASNRYFLPSKMMSPLERAITGKDSWSWEDENADEDETEGRLM